VRLEQWGKFKYYIVIFDQLQGYSRGLIWALELYVRGPLTYSIRFILFQFVLGTCVARAHIVCNELLEIRPAEILAD